MARRPRAWRRAGFLLCLRQPEPTGGGRGLAIAWKKVKSYVQEESRIIYSRNNVRIRRIRNLQTRAGRDHSGRYYVDGIRFVFKAIRHHAEIDTLLVSPPLLTNPFGQKMVRRLRRAGTPILSVPPE